MTFDFTKYHGTGNDFILIDDRAFSFPESQSSLIHAICARHFGVGADGLILLRQEGGQLRMVYFNSDGNESTMCGNGGRCFTHFAHTLGLFERVVEFDAIDGAHRGEISLDGLVSLTMRDVSQIEKVEDAYVLDTGSPHYVTFRKGVKELDVKSAGAAIRNHPKFSEEGINVNFVEEKAEGHLFMRTYERGVEAETLSCGTGVTAAAISYLHFHGKQGKQKVAVSTPGGTLSVSTYVGDGLCSNVELIGPAVMVFKGSFDLGYLSSGGNT